MAEYIERENAEKVFSNARKHMKPENYTGQEFFIRDNILLNAEQIVHAIPAADVVEARHGKWILKDKSTLDRKPKRGEEIFCDQCGEMALGYSFWECDLKPSNFCPNCGAKMDGGVNDGKAN